MIKIGVINGAKGILNYVTTQEKYWEKHPPLTNKVLFSICGNLIEKAESIRTLEQRNLENSVGVIARSFVELFVQFKFILDRETNKRAKSFYYNYKVSIGKKIKIMLEDGNDDLTENDINNLQKEIPTAQNYDDFISYYQNLADCLYDNTKNHSQKWYNLHGEKRNFKKLMLDCGFRETDYEFFYGLGSMDTHGNSAAVNMKFVDNFSFQSSIPIYVIDEAITRWLNTAVWNLSKFYKIDHKRTVKNYLNQIAISYEGSIKLPLNGKAD